MFKLNGNVYCFMYCYLVVDGSDSCFNTTYYVSHCHFHMIYSDSFLYYFMQVIFTVYSIPLTCMELFTRETTIKDKCSLRLCLFSNFAVS